MNNMIFKPIQDYPSVYVESVSEIKLACDCHKGVTGYAQRTGRTEPENYPVYKVFSSRWHPQYINERVALSPQGFVKPIKPIKLSQTGGRVKA